MGYLVGVAAGKSVEKQKLYGLNIAEGLQPVFAKTLPEPFAVTLVNIALHHLPPTASRSMLA